MVERISLSKHPVRYVIRKQLFSFSSVYLRSISSYPAPYKMIFPCLLSSFSGFDFFQNRTFLFYLQVKPQNYAIFACYAKILR